MTIYFTVPGPPVGKARPKVVRAKMAIEEMPELTKALLKHRRNEDMSVADLKSRTNIDLL